MKKKKTKYEFDFENRHCRDCRKKYKKYNCLLELGKDIKIEKNQSEKILLDFIDLDNKKERKFIKKSTFIFEFSNDNQVGSYADFLESIKNDVKFNSAINYEANQGRNINYLYK